MRCPRCDAKLEGDLNFCTQCGQDLRSRDSSPSTPAVDVEARLSTCATCGATNAASRTACARCGAPLDPEASYRERPVEDPEDAEPSATAPAERESSATLLLVSLLAGLAVIGVILTILNARGVGWFAGPEPEPAPGDPVRLEVVAARASSSLPASGDITYGPENVIDGDSTTAWNEGASGGSEGEWVELVLDRPAAVSRLLIWNGYQKGVQFDENARVALLDIDIGDRTLAAELLDVRGPQAIELPEPVEGDRIRLVIRAVHEGRRYPDAAISDIVVYGFAVDDGEQDSSPPP